MGGCLGHSARAMMGRLVAVCAPLLLLLLGSQQAADIQPPRVSLVDIRMLPGGLLEQRFQIDLRITNPNNFDVPLDGLSFTLALNGAAFANGVSNRAVVVPRLGEVVMPIDSHTTLLNLVQQVMVLADAQSLTYRLSGTAFLSGIGGGSVPFESAGALSIGPDALRLTLIPHDGGD